MKSYRALVFEYGDQLPDNVGAFVHPDGGSCALRVFDILESSDLDEVLDFASEVTYYPNVHTVVVESFLAD